MNHVFYVTYNGRHFTPTQDAYLAGTMDNPYYTAEAIGADCQGYIINWAIKADYNPAEGDESDACDWAHPSSILSIDGRYI